MPQLLVRNIGEDIVRKLRERAARQGVSMEEEHRRVLRGVLLGEWPQGNFKEFLLAMPRAAGRERQDAFPRKHDLPRKVRL